MLDLEEYKGITTGLTEEENLKKKNLEERRIQESLKRQDERSKKGYLMNKFVNPDDLIPSDETFARIVNITGTSVAEQVMRTVGNPYIVKIENIYTIPNDVVIVMYHIEVDELTYDSTQPPVGCFEACTLVLASMRFPSALITFDNVLLDVKKTTTWKDAKGVDQPVVICEAKLSDLERAEIMPHLETSDKTKKLLQGHESKMQPGFEVILDRVLESESERSQGLVVVKPYSSSTTSLELEKAITDRILKLSDQKRVFVSIHTKMENFRQISAGPFYQEGKHFIVNSAPFQKQISEELTGGAYELQEMVSEEKQYLSRFATPPEKKKYLVLLALRGFGLSPAVSNAIELNIAKAISQPLTRANDQLSKQLSDSDGPYRKILSDVKSGVLNLLFYLIGGIFLLNVFSGVTTEAINQFFSHFFGVNGNKSKMLKQGSIKRLKQSTTSKRKKKKPTRKR